MRMQQTLEGSLPVSRLPAQFSASGAYMTSLPDVPGGGGGGGGMMMMGNEDREACFGGNVELITDLQRLFRCRCGVDPLLCIGLPVLLGTIRDHI